MSIIGSRFRAIGRFMVFKVAWQLQTTCPVSQSWLSSSSIFFDLDQDNVDDDVDVIDDLDDVDAFLTSSASTCFSWLLPRLSTELPPNESGWNETEQTWRTSEDGILEVAGLNPQITCSSSFTTAKEKVLTRFDMIKKQLQLPPNRLLKDCSPLTQLNE